MPGAAPAIKCQPSYFGTWNFIMKLVQIVASVVILALTVQYHGNERIVVCNIVSAIGLMMSILWVLLYSINLNARFPKFFDMLLLVYHLIVFVIYAAMAGCAFSLFEVNLYIVAGVLSVVACVSLLVDIFLNISWMRGMEDDDELTPICGRKEG